MKLLILVAACGVPAPPPASAVPPPTTIVNVEWRVLEADAEHVAVKVVLDGKVHELGTSEATPDLCAVSRADVQGAQLVCGRDSYTLEIDGDKLVISAAAATDKLYVGDGAQLVVQPYRMPTTSP